MHRGAAPLGDRITWLRTSVDGRSAAYGVGGPVGPPVVFLHGWALGSRAYQHAIQRLTSRGCRVYAPALPAFGGTANLPCRATNIDEYGEWVASFMTTVGIDEPALVIGHSFGGGVAVKLAERHPELVRYLILLNAIGGAPTRPPWAWFGAFAREFWPPKEGLELVQTMRADLVPNVIRNPIGLTRAAFVARDADLRTELGDLKASGLPVVVLTSERDAVIPRTAFDALCSALGIEGHIVAGRHSWLLADPDAFEEILAAIIDVQVADHRTVLVSSRATELASLVDRTRLANRTVRSLLRDAPPLWLVSEPAATLAGDLALCHPRLRPNEVRAVARPIEGTHAVRLTVVAADRRGLLADSAAVLAANGLSVTHASAATWTRRKLALHAFVVDDGDRLDATAWARLGADLRKMVTMRTAQAPELRRVRPVRVSVQGAEGDRAIVRVQARDQLGLLAAICDWLAVHGVSIESLHATTDGGFADLTFVVIGDVDPDLLAAALERRAVRMPA